MNPCIPFKCISEISTCSPRLLEIELKIYSSDWFQYIFCSGGHLEQIVGTQLKALSGPRQESMASAVGGSVVDWVLGAGVADEHSTTEQPLYPAGDVERAMDQVPIGAWRAMLVSHGRWWADQDGRAFCHRGFKTNAIFNGNRYIYSNTPHWIKCDYHEQKETSSGDCLILCTSVLLELRGAK